MRCQIRSTVVVTMIVMAGAVMFDAGPTLAQPTNTNNKLCFRNVIGVPGTFYRRPPKLDGCLRSCDYQNDSPPTHDDFGWQSAFQFIGNWTDTQGGDVVAQGIYDPAGILNLSFEVKKDTRLDDLDAVVIAMKGSVLGVLGDHALLVLYPFSGHAGNPYKGPVTDIQYFPGTQSGTTITWADSPKQAPWVSAYVRGDGGGSDWTWTVEVQIQRALATAAPGITLNPGGFDFFMDVIRIYQDTSDPTASDIGSDTPWPPAATPGNVFSVNPPAQPPAPLAQWGTATINTGACGSVSFQPGDIAIIHGDPTQTNPGLIDPSGLNRFSVKLGNTLINTRPGADLNKPMVAPQVTATFRIANFGLPSTLAWADIPGGNNRSNTADVPAATLTAGNITIPPGAISAAGTTTLSTPAPGWTPDPTWTTANDSHQCILAELSSPNGDVLFDNKSAYRNMDYGHNPGFSPVAFIDGRWGPPPDGKNTQTIDLFMNLALQFAYGDGSVAGISLGKLTSQITLTFSGYRHSGRFVALKNKKVELVSPIGSFGYLVQHELDLGFATEFNKRHERQMKAAVSANEAQSWALVNKALATDMEKPKATDWKIDFPDLHTVRGAGGTLLRIEVPKDGVSKVNGTIAFNGIPIPPCTGGCCCVKSSGGSSTTPSKVASLGLVVLVGVVVTRRRRRR